MKGHPIEKVIGMIKNLKEKAIAEGKEEAVAFQKFEYWWGPFDDNFSAVLKIGNSSVSRYKDRSLKILCFYSLGLSRGQNLVKPNEIRGNAQIA